MEAPDNAGPFWKKVERSAECWQWKGALADKSKKAPYGRFGKVRAHRMAWELTHGPIQNGLHVLHRCDNTLCVNPAHLFLGTPKDNAVDKTQKCRNNPITGAAWHRSHDGKHRGQKRAEHLIRRGEEVPWSKLKEHQVKEMRAIWDGSQKKYGLRKELAHRFGVDKTTVWQVVTRKVWRHL